MSAADRPTNGAPVPGLDGDALRALVREVLRDLLPADVGRGTDPAVEVVTLRDDADLQSFVRRVATLCEDPAQRTALREGRTTFRLRAPTGGAGPATHGAPGTGGGGGGPAGVTRVERGAVTERMVARAAAEGARLHLGRGAVLTPLARDKARRLGVTVEKDGQDPGRGR